MKNGQNRARLLRTGRHFYFNFFLIVFLFVGLSKLSLAKENNREISAYCDYKKAAAALQADALLQPELTSSLTKEPRLNEIVEEEDEVITRWRYGLNIDLQKFARSFELRSYANAECEYYKSSFDLQEWLDQIDHVAERTGLLAKASVLKDAVDKLEKEYELTQRRVASHSDNLRSLADVSSRLSQLKISLIDTQTEIGKINNMLGDVTSTEKGLATNPDQLANEHARRTLEMETKKRSLDKPSVWRLSLAAGYEKQLGNEEIEAAQKREKPFYASLEVGYQLFGPLHFYRDSVHESALGEWLKTDPKGLQHKYYEEKQNLDLTVNALQAKIDVLEERRRTIIGNLASLRSGVGATAQAYIREMEVTRVTNDAELAYLKAKYEYLAKSSGKPLQVKKPDAKAAEKALEIQSLSELRVTSGEVDVNGKTKAFVTNSPSFRAQARKAKAERIEAEVNFAGVTETTKKLGSGDTRHQFGVYLMAKNQCNLLYIMWRKEDPNYLKVQLKSNPKAANHEECENDGYETVTPQVKEKLPELSEGKTYRLLAEVEKDILSVFVDSKKVWEGKVATSKLDSNGYSGLRSDNVKINFRMIEAEVAKP